VDYEVGSAERDAVGTGSPGADVAAVPDADCEGVSAESELPGGREAPWRRGVRALVARTLSSRSPAQALEPLVQVHLEAHPKADVQMLRQAYEIAERAHRGQYRKSGEPFITHPLAVGTILAELGMDTTTLVAALLHDVVEDTEWTLEQVRDYFGGDVAYLVDGVTKLDKLAFGPDAEAETIRKMIVATGRDLRVLVIKLADRLHNMRTLRHVPKHKQERKARETLEVLVPLADRLGIHMLKREIEDIGLTYLDPERYGEIAAHVSARARRRRDYLGAAISLVRADLREAKIRAAVTDRPRHYYAIYKEMTASGGSPDFYDRMRLLVVVSGEIEECYATLGAVHGRWNPVPGRFKDFIATPKFNMYQSLHTTVVGPEAEIIEVMIRTEEMHRTAEYGVAAHFGRMCGKDGRSASDPRTPDALDWLQRLLNWQSETADPGEFLESLRIDLSDDEVRVFTPKGEALLLPKGSTPVDFAYGLRTYVGHRCIGARVNGRLVPLSVVLSEGDVVEILISPSEYPGPSREWMDFVKSPRARIKIRQWFGSQTRDLAIETGKEAISDALRRHGLPLDYPLPLAMIAVDLEYGDLDSFYAAVGENRVDAGAVVGRLAALAGEPDGGAR
jgi:GTP diphosphokinase / guanosine-3',5'-bis(diphosphate) 3'-diphosphatase